MKTLDRPRALVRIPSAPDRPPEAWIHLAVGLAWLVVGARTGPLALILALAPGVLLITAAGGALVFPGDLRSPQLSALGSFLGLLLALPIGLLAGAGPTLGLVLGSAVAFVASGRWGPLAEGELADVPALRLTPKLLTKVAIDEAVLALMRLALPFPRPSAHRRTIAELPEALALAADRGWIEHPARYHEEPPPAENLTIGRASAGGFSFEHASFDSGYEPRAEEPGRDRWLGYRQNRTAHAWLMRHPGEPRPWIVCVHGYGMGVPPLDLRAFAAGWLHEKLGLNVAFPVLPLHGPRRTRVVSGDGILSGDLVDTLHAGAQAQWDVRRLLGWLRSAEGATRIGAYGLSLGGYTVANLASLDADLEFVIAGIPPTDFVEIGIRHSPHVHLAVPGTLGMEWIDAQRLLRPVNPLALTPLVVRDRRYLFGGLADRIVPPRQTWNLWKHWGEPRVVWFSGSHLSFLFEPDVRSLLAEVLEPFAGRALGLEPPDLSGSDEG